MKCQGQSERRRAPQPAYGVWMSCCEGRQLQDSERGRTWSYLCQRVDYAGDWCHSLTHNPKVAWPHAQRKNAISSAFPEDTSSVKILRCLHICSILETASRPEWPEQKQKQMWDRVGHWQMIRKMSREANRSDLFWAKKNHYFLWSWIPSIRIHDRSQNRALQTFSDTALPSVPVLLSVTHPYICHILWVKKKTKSKAKLSFVSPIASVNSSGVDCAFGEPGAECWYLVRVRSRGERPGSCCLIRKWKWKGNKELPPSACSQTTCLE